MRKLEKKTNKYAIPKDCKTFEDKRDFLFKRIEDEDEALRKFDQSTSKHAERLGKWLNKLKRIVEKEKKGQWQDLIEKRFPHIKIRTAQRYMKLARQSNLWKNPGLSFMGLKRLYELIALAGEEKLSSFLSENHIDINIDTEDPEDIANLKNEIDNLISSHKPPAIDEFDNESDDDPLDGDLEPGMDDDDPSKNKEKPEKKDEEVERGKILKKIKQSVDSFTKNLDLILEKKNTLKIEADVLSKLIENVRKNLKALETYQQSLEEGETDDEINQWEASLVTLWKVE